MTEVSKKNKILLFNANPKDTISKDFSPLRFDEQFRKIGTKLKESKNERDYILVPNFATRLSDLSHSLLEHRTSTFMVHFSAHGSMRGRLLLEDNSGNGKEIKQKVLAELFALYPNIECVILTACYTEDLALALNEHIKYVIGMKGSVRDQSCIYFSETFYFAIGEGMSIEEAFLFAKERVGGEDYLEKQIFKIFINETISVKKAAPAALQKISEYAQAFSIDETNLDKELSSFINNLKNFVKPTELVTRIAAYDYQDTEGGKYFTLFKHKIDDLLLVPKSGNLHSSDFNKDLLYKDFLVERVSPGEPKRHLIIGEAGGGKTALSYFIVDEILKSYLHHLNNEEEGRELLAIYIPFYLMGNILDIADPYFFATVYKQLEKVKEEVYYLIEKGAVCFVFDGLDEFHLESIDFDSFENRKRLTIISETLGDETIQRIKKIDITKLEDILDCLFNSYGKCPIIMTSRIHYYDKRVKNLKSLHLNIFQLRPFSQPQQFNYILSRMANDKEKAGKIIEIIRTTPNLFDLAPIPVLLEMIVNIMFLEDEGDASFLSQDQIKRIDVYEKIVEEWCKQHSRKVKEKWKKDQFNFPIADRKRLTEEINQLNLSEVLMLVSLAMFNSNENSHGGLLISSLGIKSFLKKIGNLTDEQSDLVLELMSAVFSVTEKAKERTTDSSQKEVRPYSFSHKTILEFLVAKSIFDNLTTEGEKRGIVPVDLNGMLSVKIDFHDDEVVKFIKELVGRDENFKRKAFFKLLQFIDHLPTTADAAYNRVRRNNAVKILAYINDKDLSTQSFPTTLLGGDKEARRIYENLFSKQDFSYLDLSNTNFSGQNFRQTIFYKAKLLGAGLSKCNVRDANFEEANLTAAYLGQSAAIWSFNKIKGHFIVDDGSGRLSTINEVKEERVCKSSNLDKIIWDVDVFEFEKKSYAISAQQGNMFSIFEIANEKMYSFKRTFNETLFASHPVEKQGKLFFAGSKGTIYMLDNIKELLNDSAPENYLQSGIYRTDYPESYKNKHHEGTVFGLTSSTDNQFLFSCSSDFTIRAWSIKSFSSNPVLSTDISTPLEQFDLSENESVAENRIRKIIKTHFQGIDYLIAGTQLGWLVILKVNYNGESPVRFELIAKLKEYHSDWILDLEIDTLDADQVIFTVSGDHSAKAISLCEILSKKGEATAFWRNRYRTAILSVCVDKQNELDPCIYFGAYNGDLLEEKKEVIYKCIPDPRLKGKFWKSAVLKEMREMSDSLILDAEDANFINVSGLNKGRMLLLQDLGAIVNEDMMINYYKNNFTNYQEDVIESFLNNLKNTNTLKEASFLSSFLRKTVNDDLEKINYILEDTNEYIQGLKKVDYEKTIVELYMEFTELKEVFASVLMVYYWLEKQILPVHFPDHQGYSVLQLQLFKDIKKLALNNGDKKNAFDQIVSRIKIFLENYFNKEDREDLIFKLCYEDYITSTNLKRLCDFIGGEDTNEQIPHRLPLLKINHLWTKISNSFWTGNSHIAQTYFNEFVSKIYKCCGNTHQFLIQQITKNIRHLLETKRGKITYHDFATGFNGTIIVGVYESLNELERKRVNFIASDSSEIIVNDLVKKLEEKNYYGKRKISVEKQNLAQIVDIKPNSLDIITQNLGGHHLPKEDLINMYKTFYSLLVEGGVLGLGDVFCQPIKILAGLPDDVGAPEFPYDVRNLSGILPTKIYENLKHITDAAYPELGMNDGFYTMQIYQKEGIN